VRRYLHIVLHDPDAADELFQEFALQLVHGDLRGADPGRGRFRDFLKGTLFHLVADYRKQRRQWPGPLPADGASLAADTHDGESERQFRASWGDELLARAWAALAASESTTGQSLHAVLRFRADHPRCARRKWPSSSPPGWAGPSRPPGFGRPCTGPGRSL